MGENKILTDLVLSNSTVHATVNAPFDLVDLGDWLGNLSDEEYQRCAPGEHKACAHGITDGGRPETLNVEMIGTTVTIQHALHEIFEKHHLRLVSLSDALTPHGWTNSQGIWELRVTDDGDGTCQLTNGILAHPTTDGMASRSRRPRRRARTRRTVTTTGRRRTTPPVSRAGRWPSETSNDGRRNTVNGNHAACAGRRSSGSMRVRWPVHWVRSRCAPL